MKDNASADSLNPVRDNVFHFPGAMRPEPIEWPSVNQGGELYGIPIAVGGKSDPVHIHLADGEMEHHLLAERGIAKRIAAYLFTDTIRVKGRGTWRIATGGAWILERFVIDDFDVIQVVTLDEAICKLRNINAEWKTFGDPLAIVEDIRTGELRKLNGGL